MRSARAFRRPRLLVLALSLALAPIAPGAGLDNGVLRPPLGWSTWNTLGANFNESVLRDVADAMVSSGMVSAGYEYLNVDDGWPLRERGADGSIVVNPALFPSGMPALATYLRARGLKLGIYTSHGNLTCLGFPGSVGHEQQDAQTYASWPAALVKNDHCAGRPGFATVNDARAFGAMRDALNGTGLPFVVSVHWGNTLYPHKKIADFANMWRIDWDLDANWAAILRLIDTATPLHGYAGPGAFLDLDILEVGRGMSEGEDRAHFSMWAMLASPLIAGNDPRTQSAATTAILTNALVLAVDQDPLVVPARIVAQPSGCELYDSCTWQAWARPLEGGAQAVALLNPRATRPWPLRRSSRRWTWRCPTPPSTRRSTSGAAGPRSACGRQTSPRSCRRTMSSW